MGSTPGFSLRLHAEVFSTSGYFRRQQGFEIRVFPLLGELPKAIEPHLPVCQLYLWQHGPNILSSPATKSLDPIVVNAIWVDFPGESHGPATCGFACNCPEPEAWTMEESGLSFVNYTDFRTLFIKLAAMIASIIGCIIRIYNIRL